MIDLPKGVWRWLAENERDLARIAKGVERIADELMRIRKALQKVQGDHEEEQR